MKKRCQRPLSDIVFFCILHSAFSLYENGIAKDVSV